MAGFNGKAPATRRVRKGPLKGCTFSPRTVAPAGDEQWLRCGGCGSDELRFRVAVVPILAVARVAALVCTTCGKIFKLDGHSILEGTGVRTPKKEALAILGKESI